MRENTLEQLLSNAIHVVPGTGDLWPAKPEDNNSRDRIGRINLTPEIARYSGGRAYSTYNGVLGIIVNDEYYAIPVTWARIKLLRDNGFGEFNFYTPFAFGDLPFEFQAEWQALVEDAKEENRLDFPFACERICRANGVRDISSITIAKCLQIPEEGIEVLKVSFAAPVREYGIFTHADHEKIVDKKAAALLGKFTRYNGVTIFATTRGETMLTKDDVAEELLEAGYKEVDSLFVPLSSGGVIVNNNGLADKWALVYSK